jgi:ribosomal protein S18 acetylase RimI-like enzyme
VEIRRLGPSDAVLARDAVRDVRRRSQADGLISATGTLSRWLSDEMNVLLVALESGRPIGLALGYFLDRIDEDSHMLVLYTIEVLESHRRRGAGRRRVESMQRIAGADGVGQLWVITEMANHAARSLYAAAGGQEADAPSTLFMWPREG